MVAEETCTFSPVRSHRTEAESAVTCFMCFYMHLSRPPASVEVPGNFDKSSNSSEPYGLNACGMRRTASRPQQEVTNSLGLTKLLVRASTELETAELQVSIGTGTVGIAGAASNRHILQAPTGKMVGAFVCFELV